MTILITFITEFPCWTEVYVAGQLTPSGRFPGRRLSRSGHLQALMGDWWKGSQDRPLLLFLPQGSYSDCIPSLVSAPDKETYHDASFWKSS